MRALSCSFALCLLACASQPPAPLHEPASQPTAAEPTATGEGPLGLSPALRAILRDEMHALQRAMPELHAAVTAGDLATVARLGDQIAATFILKQKLTHEQHRELHHGVPKEFLHMDRRFHDEGRWLADAARQADAAHVADHYRSLSAACTACHARFAPAVSAAPPALPTPEPCSAEWNALVQRRLGIADAEGHGPDPGSDEWKAAVEHRLGVRDDAAFPEPGSPQWCQAVDARLPAGHHGP
jgi:hypothetical protein